MEHWHTGANCPGIDFGAVRYFEPDFHANLCHGDDALAEKHCASKSHR